MTLPAWGRKAIIQLLMVSIPASAQVPRLPSDNRIPRVSRPSDGWRRWFVTHYEARRVSRVSFENSRRIDDLLRAGQLYLSLSDAIALAIENNLDVQLERYLPPMAETDVLRARGGGLLRGLQLLVNEPPPGIGGPNGPLLTNLTAGSIPSPLVNTNFSDVALISQQQNDLSVVGLIPLSPGTPIPQYDPIVSSLINWQHTSTPEFSTVLTGGSNFLVQNTWTANFSVLQGFTPGTQITTSFDNTRFNSNALFFTYNPLITSSLGITIMQPLLRGFGASLNKRFIHIAKLNEQVADSVFRQQVIDTVAGTARLYTDLVSLNEDVKVKQESLRLAERLYEDNRNKVVEGTLPPIEVTRAQAQVAVARHALVNAEGLVRQQELIVKTGITRDGLIDAAIRDARIIPVDSVTVPPKEEEILMEDLFAEALHNRPDLHQAGIQLETARISLKGALNAVRPELDLVAIMQNNSLTGNVNPTAGPFPPTAFLTPGGFGTALGQIFRRNFPTYGIGVQLMLPVHNRVAQADAIRDELQLRQAEVRRRQLENQIRLEVADARVALLAARASSDAAVQARILQEQSVDVEQQKLDVGISTNLQLIQFQTFLAQARSTELAAKGAYAKAKIALERALGKTLDVYQVSIDEAVRGQIARPSMPAGFR